MSPLKQLFWSIWQDRPHCCAVCGYPIREPLANVFAHIYSKGARPSLKLVKANIALMCSTLVRRDGEIGCHEASHTKPSVFNERANKHGWVKPSVDEILKREVETEQS
ncbi:hypothetical protein [Gracilimonas sediminicola]|uniref:Uncharacterized protein n=1 Tax=Gracilimonas sediminicola TaxID=2952158 RepID=A0A9X2L0D9_9BACT|nr:hypothetical protein [Gracilimonas sediminicola]MCP9290033.1 hypothetical protein [Gracilimonas sediminicola]